MAQPRFSAGARVSISRSGRIFAPTGVFQVVRALPSSDGPVQYQVKSEAEKFERIVDEIRLEAFSDV
jgi:hypothetical protein